MKNIQEKRNAFYALHQSGCFVMPNPWDRGSARVLEQMGFKALASTSAGLCWSHGRADGQLGLEQTLEHLQQLTDFTSLPVNADFESGFANSAEGVYQNVSRAIGTGVAGLSIEDSSGNPNAPLRSLEESLERLHAAREAIDASGSKVLLTGRAEHFFVGVPDMEGCLLRLQAYAQAGADCLYAPGIRTREQIIAVVEAVAPKPVNVLIGWDSDLCVAELTELGVRRISVGGALARTAWYGFMQAALQIAEQGRFHALGESTSAKELNERFSGS